jgi:hypothetical protein
LLSSLCQFQIINLSGLSTSLTFWRDKHEHVVVLFLDPKPIFKSHVSRSPSSTDPQVIYVDSTSIFTLDPPSHHICLTYFVSGKKGYRDGRKSREFCYSERPPGGWIVKRVPDRSQFISCRFLRSTRRTVRPVKKPLFFTVLRSTEIDRASSESLKYE